MRAIVLGMPGSGTSYFTGLLVADGFAVPRPFHDSRPYRAYESKLCRDVNEIALGGFRPSRFGPSPMVPGVEKARQRAREVLDEADRVYRRWVFKNPENVLTFDEVWSSFDWDLVLGVYRHPEEVVEAILRDHMPEYARERYDLRETWLRWCGVIERRADFVVRFPDDGHRLIRRLFLDVSDDFDSRRIMRAEPKAVPEWALSIWRSLERKRCESTTAIAM